YFDHTRPCAFWHSFRHTARHWTPRRMQKAVHVRQARGHDLRILERRARGRAEGRRRAGRAFRLALAGDGSGNASASTVSARTGFTPSTAVVLAERVPIIPPRRGSVSTTVVCGASDGS